MTRPALYPMTPQMAAWTARADLPSLYPPFADFAVELLEACVARAAVYYGISGLRDDDEQEELFSRGREQLADGSWIVVDPKKVVTNAMPGESDHGYGCGIDFCRDKDAERSGLQPGWRLEDYRILAEEARELGLNALFWSATFREGPHVGLNLAKFGITHRQLYVLRQKGGLPAVFRHLDSYDWRALALRGSP